MRQKKTARMGSGWRCAAAVVLVAFVAGAPARASLVLLNETWPDGDRTVTDLPNRSAAFVSHPNTEANPDRVIVAPGSLTYDVTAASTTRLHTYFALPGSPATLDVGEQLVATVDFVSSATLINSTSRNFRVGLFSTPLVDTHVTQDGAGDAGPDNVWASAQGYAAFMFLTSDPGSTQLFQIGKRTAVATGNLMGSTGNYSQATSGGGIVAAAADTAYSLIIELDRISAEQMNVTFTLSDSSGVLATQTVTDHLDGALSDLGAGAPYTGFDMLAFRFSGTGAGVGEDITFTRFHVEHIPEPAALSLMALAGLMLMRCSRS